MVKRALQKLLVLDGVQSAMIIRKDGTVVGSVESGEGDEEQIAAVVSFVMAESSAMATRLGKENLSSIFVEFKEKALISVPLNDQLFLVIIASASASIAQISKEMKKNRETILSQL